MCFFFTSLIVLGNEKKQIEGGGHKSQILLPEGEGSFHDPEQKKTLRLLWFREREPKIAYVDCSFVSLS